jgi:signal transduction histidine kinase
MTLDAEHHDAAIAPGVGEQAVAEQPKADVPAATPGVDDLAEIIRAYNQVTDKLQHSHEALQSEVVRLRRELASADAQLQRSKRLSALGEMAAGIAHEIRNPLAAIQLYASMIIQDLQALDGGFDEPTRCAGEIASAVRGLDGIVGDVLNFAREIEPHPASLPVADLYERVLSAHLPAIEAAGVTVNRLYIDAPERTIYADPELLHRALLNLVRNAVDAMGQIPGPRELTLDAREDGDGLTLGVRDTGPGVDRDTIDRLFNPFFTTRATGTGLGLAIVHRIVDAHGGTISVGENTLAGHGAAFELCLPACQITPADPADETVYAGACA